MNKVPKSAAIFLTFFISWGVQLYVFQWISLVHEIGHFTTGWLTLNPSWIVSTTETYMTKDTVIVRMGGFIAWWLFTYFTIRSRKGVLIGLGLATAFDSMSRIQYQTDMPPSIEPAYLFLMASIVFAAIMQNINKAIEEKKEREYAKIRKQRAKEIEEDRKFDRKLVIEPDWIEEFVTRQRARRA